MYYTFYIPGEGLIICGTRSEAEKLIEGFRRSGQITEDRMVDVDEGIFATYDNYFQP